MKIDARESVQRTAQLDVRNGERGGDRGMLDEIACKRNVVENECNGTKSATHQMCCHGLRRCIRDVPTAERRKWTAAKRYPHESFVSILCLRESNVSDSVARAIGGESKRCRSERVVRRYAHLYSCLAEIIHRTYVRCQPEVSTAGPACVVRVGPTSTSSS